MFDLPDSWVWDFWFADDGERYHLFFLYASRALHDPELRHERASIGHAVSDDLVSWTRVADALVRGEASDVDALATWTGCVVRDDDTWFLFYTGVQRGPAGEFVQRVASATSRDLMTWRKTPESPLLSADPRWYEPHGSAPPWQDEHWRDPWVFRDPLGDGWHMLLTARAREGDEDSRGVVGHAVSDDLRTWRAAPPLSAPDDGGFGQLEVMQVASIDDEPVLVFSYLSGQASEARRREHPRGAVWAAPADSVTGPFHVDRAYPLVDDDLYVGRLLQRRDDPAWLFFAFRNRGADGGFPGGITDPLPVHRSGGRLVVDRLPR